MGTKHTTHKWHLYSGEPERDNLMATFNKPEDAERAAKALNRDHLFSELVDELAVIVSDMVPETNDAEYHRLKDLLTRAKAAK